MLLPALKSAREQARIAVCTNKHKQLGLALQLYLPAWDERFPSNGSSWSNWHSGYIYNMLGTFYSEGMQPRSFKSAGSGGPLRCPSVTPNFSNSHVDNGYFEMTGNYRLSGLLVRSGPSYNYANYLSGRPVSKVKHPSSLVVFYETPRPTYGDSVKEYFGELPPGTASYWSAFSYGGYPRWFHRSMKPRQGGNVMLYMDGHAGLSLYRQHYDAVVAKQVNWFWHY